MSSSARPEEPTAGWCTAVARAQGGCLWRCWCDCAECATAPGSMLLDALLQPGSSVSRGTLSFLDKIFIALFACIFFLIWLTNGRVRLHTSSLSSTEPRDAWPDHSPHRCVCVRACAQEFHTYVFLFLAAGLVGSVKFFVSELRKAEAAGSIPLQGGASQVCDSQRANEREQAHR